MSASSSLEKVTIRLDKGTIEKLRAFYPTLKYNIAIRKLVSRHIRRLEERANQHLHEALSAEEAANE